MLKMGWGVGAEKHLRGVEATANTNPEKGGEVSHPYLNPDLHMKQQSP